MIRILVTGRQAPMSFDVEKVDTNLLSVVEIDERSPAKPVKNLQSERKELREKILGFGPFDEFAAARDELTNQVAIIEKEKPSPACEALKTAIAKIQSLDRFYLPTKEPARKHISEMLSQIESVQHPLRDIHDEKLNQMFAKLKLLYQKAQRQIEEDNAQAIDQKSSCSLVCAPLGIIHIPQEKMDKLLPLDANGKVLKGTKGGTKCVNHFEGIFCKKNPKGHRNQSIGLLRELFCRRTSAPSEVVILKKRVGDREVSFTTQFSLGIKNGISMQDVLFDHQEWVVRFNPHLFGIDAIFDMLAIPEDNNYENIMVIPIRDAEDYIIDIQWQMYDEEEDFAYSICEEQPDEHFCGGRSGFWTLSQIESAILPSVRQVYGNIKPAANTLQWLYHLWELNQDSWKLHHQGHISSEKMQKRGMPLKLVPEAIPQLYLKAVLLKKLMKTWPEGKTYNDLFRELVPELEILYKLVRARYPNDPFKALWEILKGGLAFEKCFAERLDLPFINGLTMRQYLKSCTHKQIDFDTSRTLLPEEHAEMLLRDIIDFSLLDAEDENETVEVLKKFPLNHLTLRNWPSLTNARLLEIIRNNPQLQTLRIIGCPNITSAILTEIAKRPAKVDVAIAQEDHRVDSQQIKITAAAASSSTATRALESSIQRISQAGQISLDQDLTRFSERLEKGELDQIIPSVNALSKKGLAEEAKAKLVDKLLTSDLMRQIVQNDRRDLINYFLELKISLLQKNAKGETFFHLCCEYCKPELLKWICGKGAETSKDKKIDWKEIVDYQKRTPCHVAASHSYRSCIAILKEAGAPLDEADKFEITPLRVALDKKDGPLALYFIEAGVNLKQLDRAHQTLMHVACKLNLPDVLPELIKRVPEIVKRGDKATGNIPLFTAMECNHPNQLQFFKWILAAMNALDQANPKKDDPKLVDTLTNDEGLNALMFAAKHEKQLLTNILLQNGASRTAAGRDGMTAAHVAAMHGSVFCLQRVIGTHTQELERRRSDGKTVLHLAASGGHKDCIDWLRSFKHLLMLKDSDGLIAVHHAAKSGKKETVCKLLDSGIPVDENDNPSKVTPLMLALKAHQYEVAAELLRRGAKLDAVNHRDFTVLHIAAKEGDADLVRYLCETLKMDPNLPVINASRPIANQSKPAAIHLAAGNGNIKAVEALLDCGADSNKQDSSGKAAIHIAADRVNEDILRLLINRGANIALAKQDGWTALHYLVSASPSRPDLVELILSRAPQLIFTRLKDDGTTLLHRAMYMKFLKQAVDNNPAEKDSIEHARQLEIIRILLRYLADVNTVDDNNYLPLHLAARFGRVDFVLLLLRHGSRVDVRNKYDRTPEVHGQFFMNDTPDEDARRGIAIAVQLIKDHRRLFQVKNLPSSIQERFFIQFQQLSTQERARQLMVNITDSKGFDSASLLLARRIEEDGQLFPSEFTSLLRDWNQAPPQEFYTHRSRGVYPSKFTSEIVRSKCLEQKSQECTDEWTFLLPFVSRPAEALTELTTYLEANRKTITTTQIKAVCAFIKSCKNHECYYSEDFETPICTRLSTVLDKLSNSETKEDIKEVKLLLANPKNHIPPLVSCMEGNFPIKAEHTRILGAIEAVIGKKDFHERNALLDQLIISIMKMNKEWFSAIKLRDFRRMPLQSSPLIQLETASKNLIGNCLIFLMNDTSHFNLRFEFIIDWITKSALYGDLQQTYCLYKALIHPAIIRLHKLRKTVSKPALQKLDQFSALFSPFADFQHYFDYIGQRHAPVIPAFAIYSMLSVERTSVFVHYPLMRHMQECRNYSKRLVLSEQQRRSECLSFLSQNLYPQQAMFEREPHHTFIGEGFAWKKSLELQSG